MMDIKQFTRLVESTLTKSDALKVHNANLSKPAGNLIAQYGPLTDKISKQRAVDAAIQLWNAHRDDRAFVSSINQVAAKIEGIGGHVVNSSVMSIGALGFLKDNFASTMATVLSGVKPEQNKVAGIILAVMDAGITSGLAFVPVVGPFLVPLSQGLGSAITFGVNYGIQSAVNDPLMLFNSGNASQVSAQKTAQNGQNALIDKSTAATNVGKAVGSGVTGVLAQADKEGALGQLAAQKGIASLVYTAIGLAVQKNEESVLKNCDANTPFTKMMLDQLKTQNQQVAQGINDLKDLNLILPKTLRSDQANYYLDEKKTLQSFINRTNEMYKEYYSFIEKVINLGITASFAEPLARMGPLQQTNGRPLKDSHRIALLILGYYQSKNWSNAPKPQRPQATVDTAKQRLETLQQRQSTLQTQLGYYADPNTQASPEARQLHARVLSRKLATLPGEIQSQQQLISMLEMKSFWQDPTNRANFQSAFTAYQQTSGALKKEFFVTVGTSAPGLPDLVSASETYFEGLKGALVGDITSGMSNATTRLDSEEMVKMWKLYIGANLIVNQSLRDAALKTESKLTRFTTFIKPKTAATLADERYVKMIDEAGFIERHTMNTLNDREKERLASSGKIRWRTNITSSPSDAERAMLITFCIIVAFFLDVGKISLGFVSWEKTKLALADLCRDISRTRFS